MTEGNPTQIGRVQEVHGATIKVALDSEMAGVSPIYRGQLQSIGQVGSLVRIPQGLVDLIATVRQVSISETVEASEPTLAKQNGRRILEVQLIGQIDRGTDQFQRGIGTYPGLDDPVNFTTPSQLKSIFPEPNDEYLELGYLFTDESVPITLEAERFVVQHAAIIGSTGSGKTSTVASILQNFVEGGWEGGNIIVIDPHGEYTSALEGVASIRDVLGDRGNQLRVPFWALPAEDILQIFLDEQGSRTFFNRFEELVTDARCNFVEDAEWVDIEPSAVSADTPVPFSILDVWYELDSENNKTLNEKGNPETVCEVDPGDADTLQPAEFEPYGPAGSPPHKGARFGTYGTVPDQLRLGLLDPRLQFFREPVGKPEGSDPLLDVMKEWLGEDKPISVLDFSGVPNRAADVAVGVILDLLFEVALRSKTGGSGIGRPSPVLVVLEEAHRYLGNAASGLTRDSANRIAREGRKYGVGLLAVTQRPTELPETALAQCGTLISLRLTNSADQGTVKAALPDTVAGIADVLPSLRTHEAIVSGEAVELPVRAFINTPTPWPQAEDPSLGQWRSDPQIPDIEDVLLSWRGTYQ